MSVASPIMSPVELVAFSLTAAQVRVPMKITGTFFRCVSAQEDFVVKIHGGVEVPFFQGGSFQMPNDANGAPLQFQQLEFGRKAGAVIDPNAIQIIIGSGRFDDSRATIAGTVTVNEPRATGLISANDFVLVAATNTLLLSSNTNRKRVIIYNQSAVDSVRLDSTTATLTAGGGFVLPPQSSEEFFVTGSLYARSAGTPTLSVAAEQ